jgi:hypothetical protein
MRCGVLRLTGAAIGLGFLLGAPLSAAPLSPEFTYQGQLLQSGLPTGGTCDLQFSLYDAASGGSQLGSTQTTSPVSVTSGLFTVELNDSGQFGANVFDGSDRWLQIAVRCPVGSGSYVTLSPRQQLSATPYALYAPTAGSANGLSCSGCVSSSALGAGAVTATSIASGTIQQSNLAFTPGTVMSITAGTGLSGGTITTSGTISNSGVLSVGASAPLASSGGQNPSLSLTGTVPVANGGTGAGTAAGARTALGAAGSGANSDITSLSGITDVSGNTRLGLLALNPSTGIQNTAVGKSALAANTFSGSNTAVGWSALAANTGSGGNTAVGASALAANTGARNTGVGSGALTAMSTGDDNAALGRNVLSNLTAGSSNIAIGSGAGGSLTSGSNDIYIGNAGANESNTTRIGTTQTKVFMAGISGVTSTGGAPVYVNASGQLGTSATAATRFTDNGNGTVTDHTTGLMWEKKTGTAGSSVSCPTLSACSDPRVVNNWYTWSNGGDGLLPGEAADGMVFTNFLERLNGRLCSTDACTGLGGHTDWRLPTIGELKSILDLSATGCGTGSSCINPIFGPTALDYYWAATTTPVDPKFAWHVNFSAGYINSINKTASYYVRAVRGGL